MKSVTAVKHIVSTALSCAKWVGICARKETDSILVNFTQNSHRYFTREPIESMQLSITRYVYCLNFNTHTHHTEWPHISNLCLQERDVSCMSEMIWLELITQ